MFYFFFHFIKVTAFFKPSQIHKQAGHICVDNRLDITHFSI